MTTIEVLNQIDAVPESSVVIDVAMSNPIYRGQKGEPGPIGPIGKPGPQGKSGVYVGEEEPTDESTVWIDPEGGATVDYATEQFVEEAIASIPKPDLSEYAKISDIPDTSNNATYEYVDKAVAAIEIPDTSGFALKSEIPDTSNLALKSEIPDTSAFITADDLPDTSNFTTEEEVNALINTALGVIENGTY